MKKILIAYFTRFNSTLEAAALMAQTLREQGWDAEVKPLAAVSSLEGFDAVVIGAPINGMRWVPEAAAFVGTYKADLQRRTVGFYCMSYIYFTGSGFWKKAIEGAFSAVSKLVVPVMTGVFPGRIDASLPSPMRFIFGISKDAPLNLFDPEVIRRWSLEFAEKLR